MQITMTRDEIETHYEDEWVLLEDPIIDERKRIAGGKVLCHSANRDEIDKAALTLRPKHSAFLYIGDYPDNILLNLWVHTSTQIVS